TLMSASVRVSGPAPDPRAGRKKVVLVSGMRIFPAQTGGQLRSSGIARSLARMGYDVLVYSLAGRREDYRMGREPYRVQTIESRLTEETHLGPVFGLMQTVLRRLGQPRFWHYSVLSRGWVPRRLEEALDSADLVLSDFAFCPPVPGPWASKPWYLISHRLEHRLLAQGSASERRFAQSMRQVESEAPRRYRDIFACAEEDQEFFRAHDPRGRLGVPIIRCGVDSSAYIAPPGARDRVRSELGLSDQDWLLVFSGSRFGPNMDA